MSEIKQDKMDGLKRVNINITIELHNQLKAAAAARGDNMPVPLPRTAGAHKARRLLPTGVDR